MSSALMRIREKLKVGGTDESDSEGGCSYSSDVSEIVGREGGGGC